MSETIGEAAAEAGLPCDHVDFVCSFDKHEDGGVSCMFCSGGLWACTQCGGFEGSMPTQCPKVDMTEEQRDLVYTGKADYRGGKWTEDVSYYSPSGYKQIPGIES